MRSLSFRAAFTSFVIALCPILEAGELEPTTERVVLSHPAWPTAESFPAERVTVVEDWLMKKEGANTPIEALRQLPFFVGTTATENDSNGGNGTAHINLYALGSNNVVTLINGRRAFSFSNINAIPLSALSRTEIIDSGLYGSDSAGGVVNFIMLNGPGEKQYEGGELYALYGNTTDADAHVRQVYLKGGVTGLDGKVSIAAAGEYYSRANLYSRDREISRTGDTSNDATGLGFGGLNNNSPTYAGRVSIVTAQGGAPAGQLTLRNLSQVNVTPADYRAFDVPAGTDPNRFNFRAFSPAIPAVEKSMYLVAGRDKIFGDGLVLYGDILDSHLKQDNGQSGTPFTLSSSAGQGTAGRSEARASQFNPFADNLGSVRYRLQQEFPGSGRRSFFDQDYQRYEAGINGDFYLFHDNAFISRFNYDAGFVYEDFAEDLINSGDARRSYIRALIAPPGFVNAAAPLPSTPFAGTFNPFIGQFAPITGTAPIYNNTNPAAPQFKTGVPIGTAPYDNSLAALDWTQGGASYIGHSFFFERDSLYDAKANAHLFPNWWNGGVDVAVGYEHREANSKQIPDPVQASGDQLGFAPQPSSKFRQEVDSWFFELGIALVVSTMNVPGVRSLDLDIAWRHEEFRATNLLLVPASLAQTTGSFSNENPDENFSGAPTVSLRYQPHPDIMLRASWRQSIRPPNFTELFDPITLDSPLFFGIGPFIQPPSGFIESGNPTLKPETTDSYSAGVVWSPMFIPGLTITADGYQLYTTNLILEPQTFAQVLLANNVLAPIQVDPTGAPFCDASIDPVTNMGVVRDTTGAIQCVYSPFGNAGKRHVQGLEVTASYLFFGPEGWGLFTVSGGWNHFFTWKAQPGVGAFNNFLGNYNNGTLPLAPGAIPWNKGFLRLEWKWGPLDFIATGNYIGDFHDDPSFDSIVRDHPRNVPSYITLDLQLSYEFARPEPDASAYVKESKDSVRLGPDTSSIWQRLLWGTKFTVGVNNAFDRNPPTVLAAPNDNYDTSLYSIRNRYYYVALTKKF